MSPGMSSSGNPGLNSPRSRVIHLEGLVAANRAPARKPAPGRRSTTALQNAEARSRAILKRTPMGRWGMPGDLVGLATFLAADAARFVTGAVLPVNGGYASM